MKRSLTKEEYKAEKTIEIMLLDLIEFSGLSCEKPYYMDFI